MFCAQCGNQVTDSAKFCSRCGNALSAASPVEAVQTPSHLETSPPAQTLRRRPVTLIAAAVVIGLLIGAFVLSRGDSANVASCKEEVKDMLFQPSSVEWGKITEREIPWEEDRYNGMTIVDDEGNPYPKVDYVVEGTLKSATALGAMLLTNFSCGRESVEDGWNIDLWGDGDERPGS